MVKWHGMEPLDMLPLKWLGILMDGVSCSFAQDGVGIANARRQQRHHPGHGIVELLWLEKTSKIKKSNHQPNSTKCPDKLWVEMLFFHNSSIFWFCCLYFFPNLFRTSLSEFQLISPFSCSLGCVHFPISHVLPCSHRIWSHCSIKALLGSHQLFCLYFFSDSQFLYLSS